ncbi:M48 family metallopeptidase [Phyllobacterium myrsinacearum]|uniref:Zn-dependent protease with chaperone function n=1 Tax=Phyllobacterium myrsinacearum TaxID=28101 RepID=A0A839EN28_9HYPH|nr:M48 family metallopeptidase [Phyllobacterium myrsinacearum]MBA8880252.1 Zn-dependent protease with chaperone function [Phyllobacterium myrsinacearum]
MGNLTTGLWHREGSSAGRGASLIFADDAVSVVAADGTVLSAAAFDKIDISDRVGSIPRRLTYPDRTSFETMDNDAIDALVASQKGSRAGWVHRAERVHPRLLLFVLLTFLFAFSIYRYAVPALVEVAVLVTPPVVPKLMSQGTLQTLDTTTFSPSTLSGADKAKLHDGFEKVAAKSERGAGGFDLQFRSGGLIGPNAFALPDGTVIITDELVKLADGDTEMLLGVLAHEIGHVELKHSLRQIYRAAGVTGLIMLIGGDIGDSTHDILVQGGGLLALSYSRAYENAADRHSVELMQKAGYDPAAIARFFALVEDKMNDHSPTSMLETHPGTPERRTAVLDYAQELKVKAAALPN